MTRDTEELQRIWHSTIHRWNRKRLSRRGKPFWDTLILTAANATQARGYNLELQRRREIGMIAPDTQILIVPDRAGKRIGSGGATLWALRRYAARELRIADCGLRIGQSSLPHSSDPTDPPNPSGSQPAVGNRRIRAPQSAIRNTGVRAPQSAIRDPEDLFRGGRVLMLHCGGEGRRVPSNAGTGKLFASLPFEVVPGRAACTFDALYAFLCACAERMDEGLVVVSGDVMAVFDPARLHWRREGCCGVGIPVPLELASHHGVYVSDASGHRVMLYPQKPSPDQMRARGWTVEQALGWRLEAGGTEKQAGETKAERAAASSLKPQVSSLQQPTAYGLQSTALVDGAGILKFSVDLCGALAGLAGVEKAARNGNRRQSKAGGSPATPSLRLGQGLIENSSRKSEAMDLYTDLAWTLVPGVTEQEYFANLSPGKTFVRRALWNTLRSVPCSFSADASGMSGPSDLSDQSDQASQANRPDASSSSHSPRPSRLVLPSHSSHPSHPFWLDVMDPSLFIHLGNLRQIIEAFAIPNPKPPTGKSATPDPQSWIAATILGSRDVLASYVAPRIALDPRAHVHNSFLDGPGGEIGPHCLVAECRLGGSVRLGSRVLLRGIQTDASLRVESEVALFGIPLVGQRPARKTGIPDMAYCIHGILDNPKEGFEKTSIRNSQSAIHNPQSAMSFLGMSLSDYLRQKGLTADDLWPRNCPAAERSLWNARLHPVGDERALEIALWMQSPDAAGGAAKAAATTAWRRARRVSFAEVFEQIDYEAGFRRREALVFRSLLENLRTGLRERRDCRAILHSIGAASDFMRLHRALREWIAAEKHPLAAARMLVFEAELLASKEFADALTRQAISDCGLRIADCTKEEPSPIRSSTSGLSDLKSQIPNSQSAIRNPKSAIGKSAIRNLEIRNARDASLRKVAEAVASGVAQTDPLDLEAVRAERVLIASPARIDFGGGWTDTPPQCLERGGVILSAAIRLNGEYPIRVSCEKIEERAIRIESAEARGGLMLRRAADLPRYQRLDDPFGLVKAALGVIGLCNEGARGVPPLEKRLAQWGCGLRIATRGNVPKGSGLGTSSILGAAAIACLRRVFGAPFDSSTLLTIFRQVLYLEQLLTAGGGWQDQLGALVPGIKLAQVPADDAAFVLRPKIEPLHLPAATLGEINKRLVLFYVGKRRVAFNMLREIVTGYLSGNPDSDHALRAIHDLAFEMRESLRAGDLDRFGAQMTRTRLLYRLLCPATTSDLLEAIFAAASPYVSGGKCVGAGGGGFTMFMARSENDARLLRERLTEFSWRGFGGFYDFDVDPRGLHEADEGAPNWY